MLQVVKERSTQTQYLHDFCDGQVYKEHPLLSTDNRALQLILYTDEVETANPLGSYRGQHKLSKYILLLNCLSTRIYPLYLYHVVIYSCFLLHNRKY